MKATPRRPRGGEEVAASTRRYIRQPTANPARRPSAALLAADPEEAQAGCDVLEGYRLLHLQVSSLPTTLALLLGIAPPAKRAEARPSAATQVKGILHARTVMVQALWDEWQQPHDATAARLLYAQGRRLFEDAPFARHFLRAASTAFKDAATHGTASVPRELQDVVLRGIARAERRIQRGAHWLVVHHLWLVQCVAAQCQRLGLAEYDVVDIMQEGCIGLLSAADLFDVRKNVRFRTYATPWVRQAVGRYLRSRRVVAPPRALQQMAMKLRRTTRQLEHLFARQISVEEVAAAAGVRPDQVLEAFATQQRDLSLDASFGGGATLGDTLADPAASAFYTATGVETSDDRPEGAREDHDAGNAASADDDRD